MALKPGLDRLDSLAGFWRTPHARASSCRRSPQSFVCGRRGLARRAACNKLASQSSLQTRRRGRQRPKERVHAASESLGAFRGATGHHRTRLVAAAASEESSIVPGWVSQDGMASPVPADREDIDADETRHQAKRPRLEPAAQNEQIVRGTGFANRALRSVLKVFVVQTVPNYAQPWQMRPQRSSAGSAFILDTQKREILTNAHVVHCSTSVYVRRPGNPKKWQAEVLCIGHVCDLALMTVKEDSFWDADLVSLTFSSVPELQDSILVAGYPAGGDSLSITKGIVSRITMARYAYALNKLLGIQIDAAINPGNSGGPAFSDLEKGVIGGVAFSKLTHADNIGYIIPSKIVDHFLHEYRTYETYRGVCSVAFRWQDMENEHLRRSLKMPEHASGSLVYQIDPLSPAKDVLQKHDVILEVDGVDVADDGTVEFRKEERVEFTHIVRSKHIGESLKVKVLREGNETDLEYELCARKPLVPILHGVQCMPEYFIIGGLVFVPLSIPFLEHAYGSAWRRLTPAPILSVLSDYAEFDEEQVVILFQILAAEMNFGYKFQTVRLEEFNGVRMRNLKHLAGAVQDCREKYMKFALEGGKYVILDAAQAQRESPHILSLHCIAFDRSTELRNGIKPPEDATAPKEAS